MALREIAKLAIKKGTGARGLRHIMENLLLDAMFMAPLSFSLPDSLDILFHSQILSFYS